MEDKRQWGWTVSPSFLRKLVKSGQRSTMTTEQYLKALKQLGLSPHGIKTREALGLSARQLARLAKGAHVTRTLELLLSRLLSDPR